MTNFAGKSTPKPLVALVLALLASSCISLHPDRQAGTAGSLAGTESIRLGVVKIYVAFQGDDYAMPWQSATPGSGTGTGFIIDKRRILTNAHIVSNARSIEVQKDGSPTRYRAVVTFIGHDCDLATLDVADKSFFDNTQPLAFADSLPRLNDEVTVFGYPLGGARLSVTRGVVSRIDYSTYSHSGVDQHLVLQVDAAINPGNSGGPIVYEGKVVALAFQGLAWAENIGYGIPLPVVQRFLTDIRDDKYHGYPELGVFFMDTRNEALRRSLALPGQKTGVVVYRIDPFGAGKGYLQPRDVLLSVDGHPIANDGTVLFDREQVVFAELLERKQWGDSISFQVWRDGAERTVNLPLTNPADPYVFRNLYDERPRYYVFGGLVVAPLTREYLRTYERGPLDQATQQLFYYSEYAKIDGLYEGNDEFVVLTRRLPHAVNAYADDYVDGIVTEVNGKCIAKLADVKEALSKPVAGYHVIRFANRNDELVLDAEAVRRADPEILASYGISSAEYFGEGK